VEPSRPVQACNAIALPANLCVCEIPFIGRCENRLLWSRLMLLRYCLPVWGGGGDIRRSFEVSNCSLYFKFLFIHLLLPGGSRHGLLDYLLTYLLTPWSRVLLEKLSDFAASQEIPCIYGTRKFITVLISARHLSLS
jgi:hypothetical protein